jgi:hypothetical protein
MPMTIEEAQAAGRPAYCYLEGGSVLRLDPHDDAVRQLSYPAQPSAWRQAQFFRGIVPEEGWLHLAGCNCPACGDEGRHRPSSSTAAHARREREMCDEVAGSTGALPEIGEPDARA